MLETRIHLKQTIKISDAASAKECPEQIVDYFSIYKFVGVEIVMYSKLLSNQKFGATTKNIMMEIKKVFTGKKLLNQGLTFLFMMHTKKTFSRKEIYSCYQQVLLGRNI